MEGILGVIELKNTTRFSHRAYMIALDRFKATGTVRMKQIIDLLADLGYNELFYNFCELSDETATSFDIKEYCTYKGIKFACVDTVKTDEYTRAFCSTDKSFTGMCQKTICSITAAAGAESKGFLLIDDVNEKNHPEYLVWKQLFVAMMQPIVFAAMYIWGEKSSGIGERREDVCMEETQKYIEKEFLNGTKILDWLSRLEYYYHIEEISRVHLGHVYLAINKIMQFDFDSEIKNDIALSCHLAALSVEISKIRTGAKLSDEKLDFIISLVEKTENELNACESEEKEKNAIKMQLGEYRDELENLKSGNVEAINTIEYNRYCYSVDVNEAVSGEIFSVLKKIGIMFFELREVEGKGFEKTDEAEIRLIASNAEKCGIKLAILSVDLDFAAKKINSEVTECFKKITNFAKKLGAGYIKITAGKREKTAEKEENEKFPELLKLICEDVRGTGVKILLANKEGTFADTIENCRSALKTVFCNELDFAFIPAEFERCGEDIKTAYRELKGFTKTIYVDELSVSSGSSLGDVIKEFFKNGYYADANALQYVNLLPVFNSFTDDELLRFISKDATEFEENCVFLNELNLIAAMIEKWQRSTLDGYTPDFLKLLLENRRVPPLCSRKDMVDTLLREQYGYLPATPEKMTWKTTKNYLYDFTGGKATVDKVEITSVFDGKEFTFPIYVTVPRKEGKHPFIVFPNFGAEIPNRFFPAEEIIDRGFAILSFNFEDVTSDDDDMLNGLSGILYPDGKRDATSPGKIAMWAWATHRVMDYAYTLDYLDKTCASVCGHSRLGKTALLAAATDKRFQFAYSNNSGCCGAALSRGNKGETVHRIWKYFPFFFCENYKAYLDKEFFMPHDQHYLMASIAPRHVYVASATRDSWADPLSEILSCVAAGEEYEKERKRGFVYDDRLPTGGDVFHAGSIGYHLRKGSHYINREDWNKFLDFVNTHRTI